MSEPQDAAPYFCACFDSNYLPKGLALYRSIRRHCAQFTFFVLCLDEETRRVLSALSLPNTRLISLEEVERQFPKLLRAKGTRTAAEYSLTCKPFMALHIFSRFPEARHLIYLDSDLYFFSDPAAIWAEAVGHSITVTEHRFSPLLVDGPRTGRFNAGWFSVRRDDAAKACLRWWGERCLEWCRNRIEDGKCGDQKYLEEWPALFPDVHVLTNKGVNVGPWNLARHSIREHENRLWADDEPLQCYHFSGVSEIYPWLYGTQLTDYGITPSKAVRENLYAPYVRDLADCARTARRLLGARPFKNSPAPGTDETSTFRRIKNSLRSMRRRRYFYVMGRNVLA